MSRIKGTYTLFGGTEVTRWLDPNTGSAWNRERDGDRQATGFQKQADGTWTSVQYTFTPDVQPETAADWYVLRVVPDEFQSRPPRAGGYPPIYTAFGPYTESEARYNAALRSEKSTGRHGRDPIKPYAVVQLLAGNTVVVTPPVTPSPVAHWS